MTGTTKRDNGLIDGEGGFSLIELCVVLVVISVLLGIAVVTFFGSRTRASDRAAQARARDALVAQKTYAADGDGYATSSALRESRVEPSLKLDDVDAPQAGAHVLGVVYLRAPDPTTVELVSRSTSGQCFWIREVNGASTYATTSVAASGVCTEPSEFTSSW